jgi:hypothetical protein
MRNEDRQNALPQAWIDEPSRIPAAVCERMARQAVREAAKFSQFKGVKMAIRDEHGPRDVDGSEVIAALDAKDALDTPETIAAVEALNERAGRVRG